MDNKRTYRSILKGTAVFGGVQAFNIVINLVRGKLVAIVLGTNGVGISSLFTSALTPIQQLSTLGINQSSIRLISKSRDGSENDLNSIISLFKLMIKICSIFALIITISFSTVLSHITFGNSNYSFAFVLLGVAIFFYVLSSGEITILQGLREYKKIAKSSIIGPLVGLFVGVPIYYFWGIKGIVPAMIVLAISSYLNALYNTSKLQLKKVNIKISQIWVLGKEIIVMGVVMMAASLIGNMTTYFLNLVIRTYGTLSEVGLFQSANQITNQYSGLIFAAMAADFYPRLSAVSEKTNEMRNLVNEQTEMVLLIVMPIAALVIVYAPLFIKLLLTNEFLPITNVIKYMALGLIFKAMAFPMGYISFSKGDKKYFFAVEGLWINFKTFAIFSLFFYFMGIKGLGYASLLSSIIDFIVASILTKWRYDFYFHKDFIRICVISLLIALCIFTLSLFNDNSIFFWIVNTLALSVGIIYSLRQLNTRIDLVDLIKSKLLKK
jgi:O-antigen/teichoic acid export membrane protein